MVTESGKKLLWVLGLAFLLATACRGAAEDSAATATVTRVTASPAATTPKVSPTAAATATATATTTATEPAATATEAATVTPSPTPTADLPLIVNRGAPANERCTAMILPEGGTTVTVYAQPDVQAAPVARLGNWADVQQIENSWYEILIPQGDTGWVRAEAITPTIGCAPLSPLPVRITHDAGLLDMTISGQLTGEQQAAYLLAVAAGQTLAISVDSTDNNVLFHLAGVSDGQIYKHLLDGESSWSGTLPVSQDYLLTLDQVGDTATFTLSITLDGDGA
jgi:hypothetical protein